MMDVLLRKLHEAEKLDNVEDQHTLSVDYSRQGESSEGNAGEGKRNGTGKG